MLAPDRFHLSLDGKRYRLTPSLRAAMRLERAYGMDAIRKGIAEGSASIMAAVVRECADLDSHLVTILDGLSRPSLAVNLKALSDPLAGLVLAMHGVDPDAEHKPVEQKPGAKTITFAEHLASLYRYATGWLGWTPAVAFNATPAEITEALTGHVDMLKAIHGVKDEEPVDLDTKARAIFGGLAQRFRDRHPEAA